MNNSAATDHSVTATRYEIRIKGHLSERRINWFDGVTVTLDNDGTTRFITSNIDQAALYGLLRKVRDLGLPLISVNPVQDNTRPD